MPPGVPTQSVIVKAIPSIAAGIAGRYYFGGIGGALLGVALYTVFVKPTLFPSMPTIPTLPR